MRGQFVGVVVVVVGRRVGVEVRGLAAVGAMGLRRARDRMKMSIFADGWA